VTALASRRQSRRVRAAAGCERGGAGVSEPTLFDVGLTPTGGEPTLGELVSDVWEGLVAHQRVPCPVCGGEMVPGYGAHAGVAAGRCAECETTLT
jgi:hypothetical protein